MIHLHACLHAHNAVFDTRDKIKSKQAFLTSLLKHKKKTTETVGFFFLKVKHGLINGQCFL